MELQQEAIGVIDAIIVQRHKKVDVLLGKNSNC